MPGSRLMNSESVVLMSKFLSMAEQNSSTQLASNISNPVVMAVEAMPLSIYDREQRDHFDKTLVSFLKEVPEMRSRPLPVFLPPERNVDLFELYNLVKKLGGFDLVSASRMWSSVATGLGFGQENGPTVKLVYSKYLKLFDKWVEKTGILGSNGSCLVTPEKSTNGLNSRFLQTRDSNGVSHFSSRANLFVGTGQSASPILIPDDEEQISSSPIKVFETDDIVTDTKSRKRKNVAFLHTLEWIKRAAKRPCIDYSKAEDIYFSGEVIKLRSRLFLSTTMSAFGNGLHSQKKMKDHPSLYEEFSAAKAEALGKLRSFEKRNSSNAVQQSSSSPSEASNTPDNLPNICSHPLFAESQVARRSPQSFYQSLERMTRKRIPIGPLYQAVVPLQQNSPTENQVPPDYYDRLIGTVVWPMNEGNLAVNKERIGKGRTDFCACAHPASIDCVRSHIKEERKKLNEELGHVFSSWRFDDMGEDVSRSWSKDDERKFRALVRLNPASLEKNFWNELNTTFPSKTKEMFVSYYFNVFVLRRRSIQNRVFTNEIDSDDDEAEYDSFDSFKKRKLASAAVKNEGSARGNFLLLPPASNVCQVNKQCSFEFSEGTSA